MLRKNPRDAHYPEESTMYEDERPRTGTPATADPAGAQFDRVSRSGAATQPTPETAPADSAAVAVRAESVVDTHSTFDGRFETEQDLRIEGTISGGGDGVSRYARRSRRTRSIGPKIPASVFWRSYRCRMVCFDGASRGPSC